MNMNQSQQQQQQQQIKKKKFNKHQHTQKVQNFKRKKYMREIVEKEEEDPTLFMSSSLLTNKTIHPLHTVLNIDPSQFLSDYSMMSNVDFKQTLSTLSVTHFGINLLNEFFDSDEKITFTRQLFQLINKLNYIKLQDEQWTYYYNLCMTEGIWTGRVPKKMASVNSMCHTYGRGKTLIEQRRKCFKEQLQEITDKIQEYLKQIPCSSIDTNKLISLVSVLVDKHQYQLRLEFERKKHMLTFDAKDHKLVDTFYRLKPRQTEIHSAKMIWKAIHDEQELRYEIALFKNWFSSTTNRSTSSTFQNLKLTKINDILTHLIFDKQVSSTSFNLTNHETISIAEFLEDLTYETLSIAESIAQRYQQKATDEKQKILSTKEKLKKPPSVDTIITVIESRQMNMIQRAQYNIEQQTKFLFPMTTADNNFKC